MPPKRSINRSVTFERCPNSEAEGRQERWSESLTSNALGGQRLARADSRLTGFVAGGQPARGAEALTRKSFVRATAGDQGTFNHHLSAMFGGFASRIPAIPGRRLSLSVPQEFRPILPGQSLGDLPLGNQCANQAANLMGGNRAIINEQHPGMHLPMLAESP